MASLTREALLADTTLPDDILLPEPTPVASIKPLLKAYSRKDSFEVPFDTKEPVSKLQDRGFLSSSKIIFIVHGFLDSSTSPWMEKMKHEILTKFEYTVILVDWHNGCNNIIYYANAASNVQSVGEWLGGLVKKIRVKAQEGYIWGIGHSLGAHLLGNAGRTSNGFNRITGLDPAGPLFEKVNENIRLRRSDAMENGILDVIHTDGYCTWAPNVAVNHYGTLIPLGNLDFYPNYGYSQPGAGLKPAGSHDLARDYFTWSVANPGKFRTEWKLNGTPAFEEPVETKKRVAIAAEMGFYADKNPAKGNFYVAVNKTEPWA